MSVCFFGDGTTNIGAFHEALNFAAVWKLPVIFVCENNLYMEYTPIDDVTAVRASGRRPRFGLRAASASSSTATTPTRSIARRMTAYAKARAGEGPSLIECMTYRHSGHSRADPAKYRPEGELEKWKERDPIKIYRERLASNSASTDEVMQASSRRAASVVDDATEKCKASPPPPLDIITTDVYADGGWAWRN